MQDRTQVDIVLGRAGFGLRSSVRGDLNGADQWVVEHREESQRPWCELKIYCSAGFFRGGHNIEMSKDLVPFNSMSKILLPGDESKKVSADFSMTL